MFNVMSIGEFYDWRYSILGLIGGLLAYFLGLSVVMMDSSSLAFSVWFTLESWLLVMFIIFFIVELFFIIKTLALMPVRAFNSREARRKDD